MALFLPDPEITSFDDLIEDLGAGLAARYAQVEGVLVEAAARRMRRILALEHRAAEADVLQHQRAMRDAELERAAALAELRRIARDEVARIRNEGLAEQIIDTATRAGLAAAGAQLAGIPPIARTITSTAASAVAALTLDLASKVDVLNSRITRFPDDVYKQVMSQYSPRVLLGAQTTQHAQAAAVQDFLSQGIGHIDYLRKDGSVHLRMPIGSYAEMVARTSAQRAWEDAGIHRMQQHGVSLGTISGGVDPCAKCAPWIGAVVSFDGTVGTVEVQNMAGFGTVTVNVRGTVADARAAGWGHPNCRDRVVAFIPGATAVQETVPHDPVAENERAEQRRLEREIRAAKRDEAAAMSDTAKKAAERTVRDRQADMRDFIARTGRQRKSYREQLHFADGVGGRPAERSSLPPKQPPTIQHRAGKGTPVGNAARHAVAQMRAVHSIPRTVAPVTIDRMSQQMMLLKPTTHGSYIRAKNTLLLRSDADDIEFTAVHELGHWLDNKLLGDDAAYGSEQLGSAAWVRWRAAVDASTPTRHLQTVRGMVGDPRVTPELLTHIDYMLRSREQFARSYAQWVAARTADPVLRSQLGYFQSAENTILRAYHWADDDFEPIGAALDDIFREKGLLK